MVKYVPTYLFIGKTVEYLCRSVLIYRYPRTLPTYSDSPKSQDHTRLAKEGRYVFVSLTTVKVSRFPKIPD